MAVVRVLLLHLATSVAFRGDRSNGAFVRVPFRRVITVIKTERIDVTWRARTRVTFCLRNRRGKQSTVVIR